MEDRVMSQSQSTIQMSCSGSHSSLRSYRQEMVPQQYGHWQVTLDQKTLPPSSELSKVNAMVHKQTQYHLTSKAERL